MVSRHAQRKVEELIDSHGRTYAADASIRLTDKPAPLYQLLVLVTLLSKPIGADLAVDAARELFAAGYRTPRRMLDATWQQRVDALGRAHYRRYDESTSTRLAESANWLLDRYRGDLRRLATSAEQNAKTAEMLMQEAPGLGPTGASIFLREVQAVWPWLRPYADERVVDAARLLGLPYSSRSLVKMAGTVDLSLFGAALIREQK